MRLYKVWIQNPYFKMGEFYRRFVDDDCERCIMKTTQNGKQTVMAYAGIVIPWKELEPYVIEVGFQGLPERALLNRQKQV